MCVYYEEYKLSALHFRSTIQTNKSFRWKDYVYIPRAPLVHTYSTHTANFMVAVAKYIYKYIIHTCVHKYICIYVHIYIYIYANSTSRSGFSRREKFLGRALVKKIKSLRKKSVERKPSILGSLHIVLPLRRI